MKEDTSSMTSTTPHAASNSFGRNLKALRKKSGLTQAELAITIGVSQKTLQRWEIGKRLPTVEFIKKLAEALHVTEQQLFSNEASTPSGWVLTVKIADDFMEEVIDMTKGVPNVSSITTTPQGGFICLGGDYSLWADNDKFKKLISDMKKFRHTVIQNGIAFGSIKS